MELYALYCEKCDQTFEVETELRGIELRKLLSSEKCPRCREIPAKVNDRYIGQMN